jgi:hypothetical protein
MVAAVQNRGKMTKVFVDICPLVQSFQCMETMYYQPFLARSDVMWAT